MTAGETGSLESQLYKIEADRRVLKAMVGLNIAMMIAVLVKLFVC